jgi:hypothetical protein
METTMARELHLTSPMMSGQDVLDVQHKLETLGYSPGEIDGKYGAATAAAVRAFQRDHGLKQDGWIGPMTRNALAIATAAETSKDSSEKGMRALAEAIKHIGVKEEPLGSNRTKFGEWFGVNGVAWCNIFVSYCFQLGAGYTICDGFAGRAAGVYPKGCAYVPTTEAWMRTTGSWLGRVPPLPGDIAIYNWDGGEADHIGIVENYLGEGRFSAIEGNTNAERVERMTRYMTQVNGFGRIA